MPDAANPGTPRSGFRLRGHGGTDRVSSIEDADRDSADRDWAAQLGPALTEAATARLLGRDLDDVDRTPQLLRLHQRSTGEPVYPAFQFAGSGQVPGVADVVTILSPAVLPLTIAAFLTASNRALAGARPIDVLRAGQDTGLVYALAAQLASAATG